MTARKHRDVVRDVDRRETSVLTLPAPVRPEPVEASPVLVVPGDAQEPEPELGADRLDGSEVLLVVGTHAVPEVAQLADHGHVALSQPTEHADRPVAVSLEVSEQPDDHSADHAR